VVRFRFRTSLQNVKQNIASITTSILSIFLLFRHFYVYLILDFYVLNEIEGETPCIHYFILNPFSQFLHTLQEAGCFSSKSDIATMHIS
jgi:hypothetical protein